MNFNVKKSILSGLIALMLLPVNSPNVEAKVAWDSVLQYGAQAAIYKEEIKAQDRYGQDVSVNYIIKEFGGFSNDQRANDMLDRVSSNLLQSVETLNEKIVAPFHFYNNNSKDINAFRGPGNVVSLNQGIYDATNYNEDEIAFVTAHEIGHGQGQHMLKVIDKKIGLGLLQSIFNDKNSNQISEKLGNAMVSTAIAKGLTLPNEWDADKRAFRYATQAGYNPGAGAAIWARFYTLNGDYDPKGLSKFLFPNDHPKNSERAKKNGEWMTEYSGGRISVEGNIVKIDGKELARVGKAGGMVAPERAYIVAGNLARVYHNNVVDSAWVSDEGTVYIGDKVIMTPRSNNGDTPAWAIADKLNAINNKL